MKYKVLEFRITIQHCQHGVGEFEPTIVGKES